MLCVATDLKKPMTSSAQCDYKQKTYITYICDYINRNKV